jgi:Ca2+-binding RTX toxin-like protein
VLGTDQVNFTLSSEVPGIADRSYTSLRAAAEEAGISRIYGGIHFQFDNLEALSAGREIGNYVVDHHLKIQTLATAALNGTALYVLGTSASDHLAVCRQGTQLIVRNHGSVVGEFPASAVRRVVATANQGNDKLLVGLDVAADSELYGGGGDDILFGGKQRDWMFGEGGNDWMFGRDGNDYLDGGDGFNHLFGGLGNDELWGRRNRDRLFGGAGSNSLNWR